MQVACKSLNYVTPTRIQQETLPYSLKGKDLIALA
jgi:superfamily II DNA/RNA helicase